MKKNNVFSGAISLTVTMVFVKILGAMYKIPLSYILTDEGMGYFNTAYTVFSCFCLFVSAGVPKAISILTAEFDSLHQDEERIKLFRVSMVVCGLFGAVFSLVLCVFAKSFTSLLGNAEAALTLQCIAPAVFFVSLGGITRGYLNGFSDLNPIALSQLLEAVCKLCFGIVLARIAVRQGSTVSVVSAYSVLGIGMGAAVSLLVSLLSCRKYKKKVSKKAKNEASIKLIFSRLWFYAAPLTASGAVFALSHVWEVGIIMRRLMYIGFSDTSATSLYGNYSTTAVPMLNVISVLVGSLSMSILPKLCTEKTVSLQNSFAKTVEKSIRLSSLFLVPFSVGLVLYAYPVLSFLFAESTAAIGAPLLSWLAPGILLLGLFQMVQTALETAGYPGDALFCVFVGCAVKLMLEYVLISRPTVGVLGAPIATVFSYGLSLFLSLYKLYRKTGVRFSLLQALLPPVSASCVSLILPYCYIRKTYRLFSSRIFCLLFGLLSCTLYIVCLLPWIRKSYKDCLCMFHKRPSKKLDSNTVLR